MLFEDHFWFQCWGFETKKFKYSERDAERERGRENEKFKGKKWRGLERRRRSKKSKAAYLSSNHVFICPCGPASMFSTTTFWMIFDQLFYLFLLFNPSRFCWLRWRFLFVLGVFIIVNCQTDVLFFFSSWAWKWTIHKTFKFSQLYEFTILGMGVCMRHLWIWIYPNTILIGLFMYFDQNQIKPIKTVYLWIGSRV